MFIPIALHQFLNQLVFLVVGKSVYSLTVTWVEIGLVLMAAVVLEHAFILLADRKIKRFSFSAVSSGFNMAFMLGTTHFGVYLAGLFAGLGQKHFFKRWGGRHFLNPSNVGLVAAFLIFPQYTYATFLDRGEHTWFAITIAVLGSLLLYRLRLLFVPYVFLAAFLGFNYLFHTRSVPELWLQLNSVGILLYAFFMLTDPRALPATRRFTVLHAGITALLASVIPLVVGPKDVNLFLALVLSSLLIPFWRHLEESAPLRRQTLAARISFGAVLLIAAIVYFSPLNLMRNTLASYATLPAAVLPVAATVPDADPPVPSPGNPELWKVRDTELYRKQWQKSTVVRRKLSEQPRGDRRFVRKEGALPVTAPVIDMREVGFGTLFYAGLAAGDINQDGRLDIIIVRVLEPLSVLINEGGGRFSDETHVVFAGEVPRFVEHAVLADFNNDSHLDLLLLFSQYNTPRPATLFVFDPADNRFHEGFTFPGKRSAGGVGLVDINNDSKLDFYVSYGVDWYEDCFDTQNHGIQDEFYVSDGDGWRESMGLYFNHPLPRESMDGMTAVFADIDGDGRTEFLLGNDFGDPSLIYSFTDGRFVLKPAAFIENNTLESMSYFPADFNNDGVFELWENGVSRNQTVGRRSQQKVFNQGYRTLQNREFESLEKSTDWMNVDCSVYQDPLVHSLCRDTVLRNTAVGTNTQAVCNEITSREFRACCNARVTKIASNEPGPSNLTYDVERFSKQLKENVLLRYNPTEERFENVLKGNTDAEYTDWTWSAFPFDIDNDGLTDLHIGNGALFMSHDENRLLINHSRSRAITFEEHGADWGVNYEDETRGVVIADFDDDGDGDLVLNNFLTAPAYLENLSGGSALIIELRSKTTNYYAVGAVVKLFTRHSVLTRTVSIGGIWNTSQPLPLHFGLPDGEKIARVEVTWPNGETSSFKTMERGYRYVIYE